MNEKTLERVAERFRVLGDPQRLRLLQALSAGERTVSELASTAQTSQANASKHLTNLLRAGFVSRRKEGLQVFYRLADPAVFQLCDLVCGSIKDQLTRELEDLAAMRKPAPRRKTRRN